MDEVKQYRPEGYDRPATRISDEAASEMSSAASIRPKIEPKDIKPMAADFPSADRLLSLLDGEAKPVTRPSDDYVSPGIKAKAKPEERTIIDSWTPRKDNGEEQLKNGRKPVKDFYYDSDPPKR